MKKKKAVIVSISIIILCTIVSSFLTVFLSNPSARASAPAENNGSPIKWVDFNIPYNVLKRAMDIDIDTYQDNIHLNWVDILAYLGAKYGGDFTSYNDRDMDYFVNKVKKGRSVASITKDMKYFNYYSRAYGAVLNGFLGEYQLKIPTKNGIKNHSSWKKVYGLKAFSPIADGFYYSDFDDFGDNRSYGYSRKHLGHDMMTSVGTPVAAVESGIIEAIGWNQYGGWRIGIRSYDKQRYYYYAHLKKDDPFAENLHVGSAVTAGDIIGYTGQTGYSIKENTNNIETPHLHWGMQLIFDEDAKDSPTQIWIDLYSITRLLSSHRCTVIKDHNTGEYQRKYPFVEENHYLKEMQASAKMSQATEIQLPIIMYHSILKSNKNNSKYIVSPELLEQDIKYIKKKGYTPVFMKEVIAFVQGKSQLPQKPIILSFDDGYYNNYYYAFPLLKKHRVKAVISIVGKMSDEYSNTNDPNPSYAHVTWDNVLEMHLSGYWEILNHSYDCHTYDSRNGVSQVSTESDKAYRDFLMADLCSLQDKIAYTTGVAPETFTYPFGAFNKNTDSILKEIGFKATLSCTEGISTIKKGDPECLYKLKRHLRPPDKEPSEFFTFLQ